MRKKVALILLAVLFGIPVFIALMWLGLTLMAAGLRIVGMCD